jgi:hypothetical protein
MRLPMSALLLGWLAKTAKVMFRMLPFLAKSVLLFAERLMKISGPVHMIRHFRFPRGSRECSHTIETQILRIGV